MRGLSTAKRSPRNTLALPRRSGRGQERGTNPRNPPFSPENGQRRSPRHRDRRAGPPRPSALGALPQPGGRGAGHHLDPRRARGHPGRIGRRDPEAGRYAGAQQYRRRARQQRLCGRGRAGGAVLRLADGPPRPAPALLHDAGRLHGGGGGDRPLLESRQLRPLPLPHRGRHRGRICGDQLDDPGADPLPLPRLDRSRHQRQLLGRGGAGGRRLAAASGSPPLRRRSRLATLLRDRRRSVPGHLRHAALAAGIAALAPDPWQGRGGAARHRRHRAPFRGLGPAVARGHAGADPLPGPPHRPRRGNPQPVLGASAPGPGGAQPDGRPGLLLQCDLLHLRPRADGFLRRPGGQRRLVHPALRRREFPGSPAARATSSTRWAASP